VKKSKGIRAKLNQLKRSFTAGRTRTVQTGEPKKNRKKTKETIIEVQTHTQQVITQTQVVTQYQYVYVPVPAVTQYVPAPAPMMFNMPPSMTAMPVPGNQDDLNYLNYIHQEHGAPTVTTGPQQPVQLLRPEQLFVPAVQQPVQHIMPAPIPMPMPIPSPDVITTQQHPLIPVQPPVPQFSPRPSVSLSAPQPVKVDDWDVRALKGMKQLLFSLERGHAKEVESRFAAMRRIAREQKFTDDVIDGWMAAGTKLFAVQTIKRTYKNAIELLDDSLLANSVRRGIARLLAPYELIDAIMQDRWLDASEFARVMRENCNPNKWGDREPDERQAWEMMKELLDKPVSKLVQRDVYRLQTCTACI
jgi:hypothetical protein